MLKAFEGKCWHCGYDHDANRMPVATATNYPAALGMAQARVTELEKMLAEQIQHTSDALRENERLRKQVANSKGEPGRDS